MARYVTRDLKNYDYVLKDSPIYLEKSRILYDTETDDLLLQISFRNISSEDIKTVCFSATLYDDEGEIIKKDISIKVNGKLVGLESHSTKEPIVIEDKRTAGIKLVIDYVIYNDEEKWVNKGKREGTKLKEKEYIDNYEFIKALKYKNISVSLNNYPVFTEDYYICSCGKLNGIGDKYCANCGYEKEELKKLFDKENISTLILEYNKELEEENKKAEEELQKKYEEMAKRIKKITKILLLILLILVLCVGLFILVKNILFYNNGKKLYDNQEYEKSIETLNKINTKKSKKLLNDVYFEYGVYLKDTGDCEKAVLYLDKTTNDINNDVLDGCYISLGDNALENKEYLDAIKYYKSVKQDSVDEKMMVAYYNYGKVLYDNGEYIDAISYFSDSKNYEDSSEWINKSKVGYIKKYFDIDNDTTYKYIHDLIDDKYEGSQKLYDELTKWEATIYASKYETDTEGSSSLSKYNSIYFHVKVNGGDRDEEITLKYKVLYPDGYVSEIDSFDNKYIDGDVGYVYWSNGLTGTDSGDLTIIFYEGSTMEEIGRHTVRIY